MAYDFCEREVTSGWGLNCIEPFVGGFEQRGVLINRRHVNWSGVTWDKTYPNIISELPLTSKGFEIVVPPNNPFNGTTIGLNDNANYQSFDKTVQALLLGHDPILTGYVIDGMVNNELIMILENKYKSLRNTSTPGFSAFQIFGYYQGLKLSGADKDWYSDDTYGGWQIQLTETKSPVSSVWFFNKNLATTVSLVDGMTANQTNIPPNDSKG